MEESIVFFSVLLKAILWDAVTLTGLNGNDIVGTLQCRIFERPADATERAKKQ
jgi:hypothetical protein